MNVLIIIELLMNFSSKPTIVYHKMTCVMSLSFQWDVGISQMEKLQRSKTALERQDPSQQRHMESLVYAV